MPTFTDQELAEQIKTKVAELNELDRKAQAQGLTTKFEMYFPPEVKSLASPKELTASIFRITAL